MSSREHKLEEAALKRQRYFTVESEQSSEFIEKKSRFIGVCAPVNSVEAAEEFVRSQRQKYPDARHCVYAWIVNGTEMYMRFSDDGEPQGTGGKPVLNVLQSQSLENVAVCVIRYFGGILLGTGGLTRAYSKAASAAVERAKIVEYQLQKEFTIKTDYAQADKLRYRLETQNFVQTMPLYTESVSWQVVTVPERMEELRDMIAEVTADTVELEVGEYRYHRIN